MHQPLLVSQPSSPAGVQQVVGKCWMTVLTALQMDLLPGCAIVRDAAKLTASANSKAKEQDFKGITDHRSKGQEHGLMDRCIAMHVHTFCLYTNMIWLLGQLLFGGQE